MPTSPTPAPSVEVGLAVLTETVRNMDAKMDHFVQSKADRVEVNALSIRVDKVEGHMTWMVRLVIGAVILAVLAGGYLVSKSVHTPPIATATQAR